IGALPVASTVNADEPTGAKSSTQESRLVELTVPATAWAVISRALANCGLKATPGASWSFGSRTVSTAEAWPTNPSPSVAVAAIAIRPGAWGVYVARPWLSRVTGWPAIVSDSPVIGARLEAATWTSTDCPGCAGKLGVSTIRTFGGTGLISPRRTD